MSRILILPNEFRTNLEEAHVKDVVHEKWLQIGVDTVQDMIDKVILELNEKFPKLSIVGYRFEDKDNIKEIIGNRGSSSKYTGYFENEKGYVDGLFFYIPPSLDSGNDILTRQVMPSLFGIYEGIYQHMVDLHFNNRPVFILNINENARSNQRAVKISFICAELLGFKYLDIYGREFRGILNGLVQEGESGIKNTSLTEFNQLFSSGGNNELFVVDNDEKILKLLSDKVIDSSNVSAEMYRYFLKVLPAIYMAIEEGYQINVDSFDDVQGMFDIIRRYLSKI